MMKDKTKVANTNAIVNLISLFQLIFALIYSFGVLYYLSAPALLWLVWIFLQLCGFLGYCFSLVAAKDRGDFDADDEEHYEN